MSQEEASISEAENVYIANGNAGTKTIVDALKQRGITINPKANQTPAK